MNSERYHKFRNIVTDMENKLKTVTHTLSLLDNTIGEGSDAVLFLEQMLRFITSKIGELARADLALIFLLDEDRGEYWAIVDTTSEQALEIRIACDEDIIGEVIAAKKIVRFAYDFYDRPLSHMRRDIDQKIGYRTYTMLAIPIFNREGNPVAVVQLLNKLHESICAIAPIGQGGDHLPILQRIEKNGFTHEDEALFEEFVPSMALILESSRSFYNAIQRRRFATALMAATQSLSKSSLDLNETLCLVMDEAKQLMDADRSTLWLLDNAKDELWANLPMSDNTLREIRIPKNIGFVGHVAETRQPLLIPFDLYRHPDSATAQKIDQETGYRTCSVLCMPVFNTNDELIGVTQLINKNRKGEFSPYNPKEWPVPPLCWKASFNRTDMEFMKSFNIAAGIALQNAKLFAKVKEQEKRQRDKTESLTQLVAKIAHELNTPASAMFSAINEIHRDYLTLLEQILYILQKLDPQLREKYFETGRYILSTDKNISTKDRRQKAKNLRQKLSAQGIEKAAELSQDLSLIGFDEEKIEQFCSLFLSPELEKIQSSLRLLGMTHIHVEDIKTAVGRVIQLVKTLKNYSEVDRGELIKLDIQQGIQKTLAILRNQLKDFVEVHQEYESIPPFLCYAEQLEQVWTNLIYNAIQAMKGKGTIYLRIKKWHNDSVAVEVEDNGPGIPPDVMQRIFEPYFTTKPKGEGTGLGLSICQKIVEKHQGKIEVSSKPGQTCFRVILPLRL